MLAHTKAGPLQQQPTPELVPREPLQPELEPDNVDGDGDSFDGWEIDPDGSRLSELELKAIALIMRRLQGRRRQRERRDRARRICETSTPQATAGTGQSLSALPLTARPRRHCDNSLPASYSTPPHVDAHIDNTPAESVAHAVSEVVPRNSGTRVDGETVVWGRFGTPRLHGGSDK
ncbi:MAG: hypothetical protein HRU17_19530 [Polyangiaceae bacterium]|nr:hypothetical protein [Polyangiaceae bacterium]